MMRRLWRDYNLSIVLFVFMLVALIIQAITNYYEYRSEQLMHGELFEWSGYWIFFGGRWSENVQSEMLQLFTFVVLTAFLIHRDSHESKDSSDRMEHKINQIQDDLELLRRALGRDKESWHE
jgi:hypothetical protein